MVGQAKDEKGQREYSRLPEPTRVFFPQAYPTKNNSTEKQKKNKFRFSDGKKYDTNYLIKLSEIKFQLLFSYYFYLTKRERKKPKSVQREKDRKKSSDLGVNREREDGELNGGESDE